MLKSWILTRHIAIDSLTLSGSMKVWLSTASNRLPTLNSALAASTFLLNAPGGYGGTGVRGSFGFVRVSWGMELVCSFFVVKPNAVEKFKSKRRI